MSNVGLTFTTPACDGGEVPVFDASGNVYVPDDIDGHIYRFGPSGGAGGPTTALPDTNFAPSDGLDSIAFGKNGELGHRERDQRQRLGAEAPGVDPTTGATERVVVTHANGFNYCPQYNLAVDPLSGDVLPAMISAGHSRRIRSPEYTIPTVPPRR